MVNEPYRRRSGFRFDSSRKRRDTVQYKDEDNGDVLRSEVHFHLHQQMYKKTEKKKESNGDWQIRQNKGFLLNPNYFVLL
jgi:hypothetical protein